MFKIVDRTTSDNRLASIDRHAMWSIKAGLCVMPLITVAAMAFDPGALGQVLRAMCEMLVA